MAHDPLFEQRIAQALKARGARPEHKKMFGGVAFMVKGHMAVGITSKGDFMVRFDGARHEEVLKWPGAKPMTFGHKGMRGFLFVDASAVAAERALGKWVDLSLAHVSGLPGKKSAPKKEPAAARPQGKKTTGRR